MKPVNKDLVQELYTKYDNWNDRTNAYNEIMNENRSPKTLSCNYSRNRRKAIKNDKNYTEEKIHVSERYLELDTTKLVTERELLQLHGYDADIWEITSSNSTRSKIGTKANDEQYFINTYSKITVKPREFKLTKEIVEDLWKSMKIEPFVTEKMNLNGKGLLLISLNDMHIWLNTYESYKEHIKEIVTLIETRYWDEIIFKQGGDWFHSNNSQGTTVSGTQVAYEVSKKELYKEGSKIVHQILMSAIENSNKTKYIYIEGNHDKDLAWGFAWGLKNLYPQIEFDIEEEVYKKHTYNEVLLLMTHGDKPRNLNTLGKVMFERYRKEMAKATTVEIHTEHVHHEKVKDDMGIVFRTNPTAAMTDKYHYEGGFIGARKIFQCFVYNEYEHKLLYNITGR